jgi:excinuclease ABC subunit C
MIKDIKNIPNKIGVYLMRDKNKKILYIGKAKDLKKRIKSYFSQKDTRAMINILIPKIQKVDFFIVKTEKEALILENNLIKKHKPTYNILLKDDKTFVSLMLTNDKWPMLKLIRKRNLKDKNRYFGPYTNAKAAKQTLSLILKLFPIRQCSNEEFKKRKKPCILYEIKKCLAPCVNKCSKEEYMENVKSIILLLKGKNKKVLSDLKNKMKKASKNLEFEKANELLNLLKKIKHVQEIQHVDNLYAKNIDAIGIFFENNFFTISQLIFRENRLIGSNHFNFSNKIFEEEKILENFIIQNYTKKDFLPSTILVPINLKNKKEIEEILLSSQKKKIKIIYPKKGEKKNLINLALQNAKALLQKEKTNFSKNENFLLQLQRTLTLKNYPRYIECFDISNIGPFFRVGSLVVFVNGEKIKEKTRLFNIKTKKPSDIYAMEEVLTRHLSKSLKEKHLPDLLIVDGGKQQLNIALKVLEKLKIASIDVIGLAKEKGRHDKGLTKEKIFLPYKKDPILIDKQSQILFFLQKIRDEAHRVAFFFHKKKREKKIKRSVLDDIKGIGERRKKILLKHFKSIENMKKASLKELQIKGISKKLAENIYKILKSL